MTEDQLVPLHLPLIQLHWSTPFPCFPFIYHLPPLFIFYLTLPLLCYHQTMGDSSSHNLINELFQGRDLARQLQMCLNEPSSSPETPDTLIRRIMATFENSLALLNCSAKHSAALLADSPPLTPPSQDPHKDFQLQHQNPSARWTKRIRIIPGIYFESLLDDGFSWRKYGQKDILGAKFPRGYYRCTHKHAQGCLATKQVQRSDEDPTVMKVNYRGNHTCKLASSPCPAPPSQEQLVNLRAGLRVLTENLSASDQTSFALSLLPSTSNVRHDNPDSMCPAIDSNVVETLSSPPYLSPATSATAHLSVSPGGVSSFGAPLNFPAFASDINDAISPAEFPFDPFQFEGHGFTFHNPRYF